jgi:hypothetical protein
MTKLKASITIPGFPHLNVSAPFLAKDGLAFSTMPERVAGHLFVDTPRGEACADCGKLWMYILDRREQWRVGEFGIAHIGGLEEREIAELHAKLERIWNCGMRF